MAKIEDLTHVQISKRNRERAQEVARQLAARESRDVYQYSLVDDILNKGLTEYEKQLGITVQPANK